MPGRRTRGSRHRDPRAPAARAPRASAAADLASRLLPVLALLLPLLLALVVHRRALGAFFSTDDFVRLEEAAGLLPQAPTLWRLVSEVLYVKLMLGLFGPRPLPFHIVSLALHLVNTAFVYRTGRRAGLTAAGACFAATVFGAFPLFYTVLLSAVNINDIMALTFVFLALAALERPTPLRTTAAVASFVLALLSKEAVVFVPFAAVLLPRAGESLAGTARRLAPLLVAGAGFAGLYLVFRGHGLGTGGFAYSFGFGANLFHNLTTYALWSIDLVRVVPDGGAFDVNAWRIGIWPLAAFALAAALSRSRRAVICFGGTWWLLGLVPVLPLLAHSYGHYLYVPIAGFALAGAGSLEALAAGIGRLLSRGPRGPADRPPAKAAQSSNPRPPRGRRGQAVAAAAFVTLAILFAARSELLISVRTSTRLGKSMLAFDPFTRKMEVARRAVSTLTGQIDRFPDSVVVFIPPGLGQAISASTGERVAAPLPGVPQYDIAEAVLGGGLAVRLFDSRIDSAAFVRRWTPAYRNFTLYIEGPSGEMVRIGRGPYSHSRFAGWLLDDGRVVLAHEYLAALVAAYPGERLLHLLFATTLLETGQPDSARAHARFVIESAPHDTLTVTARMLIARAEGGK